MTRVLTVLGLALAAAACGPLRDLDPLNGLGGPVDRARYGFEDGVQGWDKAPPGDGGSATAVFQAPGRSLYGQASLALQMVGMGGHYPGNCSGVDNAARAALDLSAAPPDLSGRTFSAWIYLPPAAQAAEQHPTQGQLYLMDMGDRYANGPGVNLQPGLWTRVTFKPYAWAGPGNDQSHGHFVSAGFDPVAIKRAGVKIAAAGSAPCSFQYSGLVLIDSVDW